MTAPSRASADDDARTLFRHAMAHLGAAVNVITTAGPHGRCGVTASAVCSVTDTPPTLLVCLNRSSSTHATFTGHSSLCVNVLPAEHEPLARHFAGLTNLPMDARFGQTGWDEGPGGLPVLRDALASVQGTIVEMKDVGSHTVLFVEATAIRVRGEGDALIYFGRAFHRVGKALAEQQ
ncbi:flavin reductase [Burkholderia plantarii]|uniref:4-hydoxyphenylacetate 3-monooxygenase reductase subunit HpaC n=1 Tax=Burkholderia plantarii TaxID=41899 RepID=A0A0B6SDV8_BURPL|nr:flavin reductase [Burkholderia plantarii]AJK50396.1 4-hydoxyphenylacetate 3-monooxygenase reductase subunit HpaC [Burkholderia plantarii]ALK34573.1 4-hydroxyphenylacetate 3-monooxygenase reductase subunit [Burkholderia plantarii]WLE63599.1 flavin reductase [Burkholderia plantarii]GLZ22550.1 4-hydroxyphenylacetate 3-monooxygenase reductase component [Burkholderia plantarii]